MSPLSILALSLSMSADAFAASIGRGAATRPSIAGAFKGGLIFGAVEAVTPLLGWAIGLAAANYVAAIDHWIAFALLGAVGGKMLWEAVRRDADDPAEAPPAAGRIALIATVLTAIGTSIDAAAVGVSLALIGVDILGIALAIGATTFAMTTIGLMIGRSAGARLGRVVELLGGVVLIAIGTTILVEHLGAG